MKILTQRRKGAKFPIIGNLRSWIFQSLKTLHRKFPLSDCPIVRVSLLSILCAFAPLRDAQAQWQEDAWQRLNTYRGTQIWWATSHSIIYTQRVTATNLLTLTNRFLFNISPTNFTSDPISNAFTFTIAEVTTNGTPTNRIYTVSDIQSLQQTNLAQNWRARIKLDCTIATAERVAGAGSDSNTAAGVRFYFNDQEQLAYLKTELSRILNLGRYISPVAYSNYIAATNFMQGGRYGLWTFDPGGQTNGFTSLGPPSHVATNFPSYTPYFDIFYTNSTFARVMTCSYTLVSVPASAIVTSSFFDCCGNSTNASGTNGQTVTIICTNANIYPGFNASAYNYYAYRRVLTNLSAIFDDAAPSTHDRYGQADSNAPSITVDQIQGLAYSNYIAASADTWNRAAVSTFFRDQGANRQITAWVVGGGTSSFSFVSGIGLAAAVDVFVGGFRYTDLSGDAATNATFYSFGTGISNMTNSANPTPRYLTFTATNWDGVIQITNSVQLADFPSLVPFYADGVNTDTVGSKGYSLSDGYTLQWFYGVPTNTLGAFRYR